MTDSGWVYPVYNITALIGVGLVIYVMQKAEHDRISRVDSVSVQWLRRGAFIITGMALCYSILDNSWHRSIPILLLVGAGVVNLGVNAIALYMRAPPGGGLKARNFSNNAGMRKVKSMAYYFFRKMGHEK